MKRDTLRRSTGSRGRSNYKPGESSQSYKDSVGEHLDVIFTDELFLFIPAFILVSLVVWFFNDKIKAR